MKPGDVLAGRYRIVEPLGRGGAATVFVAIQEPLGRKVALKVVRSDLDDEPRKEFESRFLREASLAGRLAHPNVVTVFDFGSTEEGIQFVVMELLRGRNLKVALRGGPMGPAEVARISAGVAQGLRHAHLNDLIHRDVKPSNIFLITDEDGVEKPLLVDFGLVKALEEEDVTRTGTYLGTPTYMAPEQAKGSKDIDGRADIYALGCVMYRMLTGVPPFRADNPLGLALKHIKDPVPPMAETNPAVEVPPGLEDIVRRCLAKAPEDRWQDGGALAKGLQEWRTRYIGSTAPSEVEPANEATQTLTEIMTEQPSSSGRWLKRILLALLALGVVGAIVGAVVLVLVIGGTGAAALFLRGSAEEYVPDEVATIAVEPMPDVEPVPDDPAPDGVEPESEAGQPAPEPAPIPEPVATPAPTPPPASSGTAESPERVTSPPPAPTPEPEPEPESEPEPTPTGPPSSKGAYVDGVRFDGAHSRRALEFINTATESELLDAGVYERGREIILAKRPFSSLEAFGATPYIGNKTVVAIAEATSSP